MEFAHSFAHHQVGKVMNGVGKDRPKVFNMLHKGGGGARKVFNLSQKAARHPSSHQSPAAQAQEEERNPIEK